MQHHLALSSPHKQSELYPYSSSSSPHGPSLDGNKQERVFVSCASRQHFFPFVMKANYSARPRSELVLCLHNCPVSVSHHLDRTTRDPARTGYSWPLESSVCWTGQQNFALTALLHAHAHALQMMKFRQTRPEYYESPAGRQDAQLGTAADWICTNSDPSLGTRFWLLYDEIAPWR